MERLDPRWKEDKDSGPGSSGPRQLERTWHAGSHGISEREPIEAATWIRASDSQMARDRGQGSLTLVGLLLVPAYRARRVSKPRPGVAPALVAKNSTLRAALQAD
ncbi:hypothetical protein VTN00DRAFT_1560 [Thermoascus crustaceus]|uniref:uncharacterized protein n=1 Tax=Thermoascus crustaceus TaxID=5088 RepID=UPI003743CA90